MGHRLILDTTANVKRSQNLIKQCAQKVLKAAYFKAHVCLPQHLRDHIPAEIHQALFTKSHDKKLLGKEQRHLHSRILTNALLDDVLPVLKDDPRFPERADD
jgi:hypothetical protein